MIEVFDQTIMSKLITFEQKCAHTISECEMPLQKGK